MTPLMEEMVEASLHSRGFFFKFLSANDVGATGSHQAGFYMPKGIWPLFFDRAGESGENRDLWIHLHWPDGSLSQSRFIWYGKSKREYRLTQGFHFLNSGNIGDVLVLIKREGIDYSAFLLSDDEIIEEFFSFFSLSPEDSCRIQPSGGDEDAKWAEEVNGWLDADARAFPSSDEISEKAREYYFAMTGEKSNVSVDELLLRLVDIEFLLFRKIERIRYRRYVEFPLHSVEDLVRISNTILNRRKSRAGYSLENHLSAIFDREKIRFSSQKTTEGGSRPDFIFPGIESYGDINFPVEKLTFLAVKTTCKDRWRQVLREADRIKKKHLFTLQRGITENQLQQMMESGITLVVPERYKKEYPEGYREGILSLSEFIEIVRKRE